jgi:hypothetical protein
MTFQKGFDPNRHPLTRREKQKGGKKRFRNIMMNEPHLLLWLRKRLKKFYGAKKK